MLAQLHLCKVPVSATLRDAMESLESSSVEIVLLVDAADVLKGTLTDGDIRRALLKGASLESPLLPHLQSKFTAVGTQVGRAEVLDLMRARLLAQIPVIDDAGRLVGLHLLQEIIGGRPRPNWAVIMAGGKGTRLLPITENLPKPMICVAGRPILERLVLHVVGFGIRKIFLSINHLGHIVEDHFGDGEAFGCEIHYLRENRPLGTGGALGLLPDQPEHPLLVLNGDVVTQVDFGAMIDFHQHRAAKATLGVREYDHTVPFGCVQTAADRILSFEEKPVLKRLVNTGMYVLEPDLVGRVPAGTDFPITHLIEGCLQTGEHVASYQVEQDWIDVGQRDQLHQARRGHI